MSWYWNLVPYILMLGASSLGLFALLKDWHNYKKTWLRKAVGFALCVVCVLNLVKLRKDDAEKQRSAQKAASDITFLKGQAQAATDAQRANAALFVDSFSKLSKRVSDIQTQVKTDELQKRLAAVQGELQATEKALAPGPKATLVFSFFPTVTRNGKTMAVTDVDLPVKPDGTVRIEFTFLNLTSVDAMDGEVTLRICNLCKFVTEPIGFRHLSGQDENERYLNFSRFLALVQHETFTMDISVPATAVNIQIGMSFRCHTCQLIDGSLSSIGIVHLIRASSK